MLKWQDFRKSCSQEFARVADGFSWIDRGSKIGSAIPDSLIGS
jgi:hypothetical protein